MNTETLNSQDIQKSMIDIHTAWTINSEGHLYREFSFSNFREAFQFCSLIADVADDLGHHPDLSIKWGLCNVEIWSHEKNGLTQSDFNLARHIDKINV